MTKEINKEKIKEVWSINKWMYYKESKWLPVIYTPFQDIDAFCSIYCKGKDWIPLILNTMMKELEAKFLSELPDGWESLPDKERIEITIKAGRTAQKYRDFFWNCAKIVNESGKNPFIIRMRHMDFPKE